MKADEGPLIKALQQYWVKTDFTREQRQVVREQIRDQYWQLLDEELKTLPLDLDQDALPLPKSDRPLFDFGMTSRDISPWWKKVREEALQGMGVSQVWQFRLLSDALAEAYRAALSVGEKEDLTSKGQDYEKKTREITGFLQSMLRSPWQGQETPREESKLLAIEAAHVQLAQGLEKSQKLLERIARDGLDEKAEAERKQFLVVKRNLLVLLRGRCQVAEEHLPQDSTRDYGRRLTKVLGVYLQLLEARIRQVRKLDDAVGRRQSTSLVNVRSGLKEALQRQRADAELCATLQRGEAMPLPLEEVEIITERRCRQAMDRVLEMDPEILSAPEGRRRELPPVHLLPGTGTGYFDYRKGYAVVPTLSASPFQDVIAHAMGCYRLELDRYEREGEMWKSFLEEVEAVAVLKAGSRQRQLFLEAYVTWCRQGLAPDGTLDAPLRSWFEHYIAPNPFEVIVPAGTLLLDAERRWHKLTKLMGGEILTVDEQYETGVLFALAEDPLQAAKRFQVVMDSDPDHAPSRYSAAIVWKKLAQVPRARTCFEAYLQRAPDTWWAGRAREHLARIR